MKSTIEKFILNIKKDPYHRYSSWDNCHKAFLSAVPDESHALHLAFYLASWGMYRGSCGLLQKNHFIHQKAVDILFKEKFHKLRCNWETDIIIKDIDLILELKDELANYYNSITYIKEEKNPKYITPTDTLISKIMLGTLGCVPAFDRYFITGIKDTLKLKDIKFGKKCLESIFNNLDLNQIIACQDLIRKNLNYYYPIMKIIDMYYWQIGYDVETEKNKIKMN